MEQITYILSKNCNPPPPPPPPKKKKKISTKYKRTTVILIHDRCIEELE